MMEQFLIMYAPILIVALSIVIMFVWGARGKFLKDIE